MQNDSKDTKWEHYVPRVYYKGFSEIIKKKKSKEKLLIWALNVKTMQQTLNQKSDWLSER